MKSNNEINLSHFLHIQNFNLIFYLPKTNLLSSYTFRDPYEYLSFYKWKKMSQLGTLLENEKMHNKLYFFVLLLHFVIAILFKFGKLK